MSKRTRLLELQTAAALSDSDLERERMKGDREARTTGQWINAISGIVPAAAGALGAYGDSRKEKALGEADSLIADAVDETGEEGESASAVADRLLGMRENLAAPKKTGNVFDDFMRDPLGLEGDAREKARLHGRQGLTGLVKKNRTDAAAAAAASAEAKRKQEADELAAIQRATSDDAKTIADQRAHALRERDIEERSAEGERDRAFRASESEKDRAARAKRAAGGQSRMNQLREEKLEVDLAAAKNKPQADRKKAVAEVENRTSNLRRNLDKLDGLIEEFGTVEVFGSEAKQRDNLVDLIAIDMAKLVDPESVARESEVAAFRKLLDVSGWQRESTARSLIAAFRDEIEARRSEAYRSRGIDMSEGGSGDDADPFADLR